MYLRLFCLCQIGKWKNTSFMEALWGWNETMAMKALCQTEDTANDGNVSHSIHLMLFSVEPFRIPQWLQNEVQLLCQDSSRPSFNCLSRHFFSLHRLLNDQEWAQKGPLKNQPSSAPTRNKLLFLKCLAPLHKFSPEHSFITSYFRLYLCIATTY